MPTGRSQMGGMKVGWLTKSTDTTVRTGSSIKTATVIPSFQAEMQTGASIVASARNRVSTETDRRPTRGAGAVAATGARRIDNVVEDAAGSEFVIENQCGKADHDQLTHRLAYAVARGARGLVVVAE